MTDYTELVKNLRFCATVATALDCDGCEWKGGKYSGLKDKDGTFLGCEEQIKLEAADAIEELTGFVQEAERDRDEYRERLDKTNDLMQKQWIPVTERLPGREWVLCKCRAKIHEVLSLRDGYWYHDPQHQYMSGFVTHWMPLPDPPKEEHSPVYESIKRGLEQAINGETREEETE